VRALIDYLKALRINAQVFDTEGAPGVLHRFYPAAKIVDIAKVPGQMLIFDALPKAGVTIVDVRAGLLSPALRALQKIGLLDDVRQQKMTLVVIHVLGGTKASLDEVAATAALLAEGGTHLLIKNYVIDDAHFYEWDKATHDSYFHAIDAAALLTVPHLDAMAAEMVENESVSFAAFADENAQGAPERSRVLRGYVRHWLNATWAEFHRAGLARIAATGVAASS
jgi:hypothetical protein